MNDAISSEATKKLIAYGKSNPKASDTSRGIAEWWVGMPLEEVLPALESLVERGLWEKLRRDDRVIYRPAHSSEPGQTREQTDESYG